MKLSTDITCIKFKIKQFFKTMIMHAKTNPKHQNHHHKSIRNSITNNPNSTLSSFLFLLLLLLSLNPSHLTVASSSSSKTTKSHLPSSSSQTVVNISGDFILGALFPIHRRGSNNKKSSSSSSSSAGVNLLEEEEQQPCGEIQSEDGIQPLEALLYTIDKINQNETLLPGIRLGVLALDTCDSTSYAMEQSMIFVKSLISHYNEYHETEFHCSDGSAAKFRNGNLDRIIGVIGGQSSSVTIQVASLLRLFQIPQISYMSTSPQLSNRERFPYFFRTVPSDLNQAHALIDILRYFNWQYVAVVYSDSEYGLHCYESLRDLAGNDTICFTTPHRVIRYQFQGRDYEQIMRAIGGKPEIRVILLILEKENAGLLMKAAQRLGVGSRYVWVGTDGWTGRGSVALGIEDTLEGAIAIQPLVSSITGFDDYFTSLTLENHSKINPWFEEFWEQHFQCTLKKSNNNKTDPTNKANCTPSTQRISKETGYTQQSFVHFVRDAAYAFAVSLHNMHLDLCGGRAGVCDAMRHVDGGKVFEYMGGVSFKDEEDNTFRFENEGPTRYTIVNFQRDEFNQGYSWVKVGNYSVGPNQSLVLEMDERIKYRPSIGQLNYPKSTCATPCQAHQVKVRERDDTCCWKCRDCGPYQIKHDDFHCDECPIGTLPDHHNHSQCLPIPEKYIDYKNPLAIGALGVSAFGIVLTISVTIVFTTHITTPIIKASGRELSYILLFAILLSFSVTFFIVAEPSQFTCGVMRFFLGFCPTLCYASIATKMNRIARIFHHNKSGGGGRRGGPSSMTTTKTKFISPGSQMIIVGMLTSVEVLINVVWIVVNPPGITYAYPDRGTKLRICEGVDSYRYMIGFIYPLILIGLCTIYAIQTRKCPEGFNETKYIAFTNYTIIIIWLAFLPLYLTSSSSSVRVVTLAISLSLSGLVELACLFFPKIYIVLFKPEKNTKEVVMAPNNRSSFLTLSNNSAASNNAAAAAGIGTTTISNNQQHNNGKSYYNYSSKTHQYLHPEDEVVVVAAAAVPIISSSISFSCDDGGGGDPPSC